MNQKIICFLLFLTVFIRPLSVLSQPPDDMPPAEAVLVSEVNSIQPGKSFWIGFKLVLQDGWHTYWQNPGDSGLPASIEWELPENLKAGDIEWPYPEKILIPPFVTFGYEGEVLLLVQMTSSNLLAPGSEQLIRARAGWLSCKEICVPGKAELSLRLPVLDSEPILNQTEQANFQNARKRLPQSAPFEVNVYQNRKKLVLRMTEIGPLDFSEAEFFPSEQGFFDYSKPKKIKKIEDGIEIELHILPVLSKPIRQLKGVLVSSGKAYSINSPIKQKTNIFQWLKGDRK